MSFPIRALVVLLILGATAAVALFLFPFDSDGALAVNDGVWFGIGAEEYPAGSISPHHPLFHVLAAALVPLLRSFGAEHPGHLAVRILAGAGAAWLLLQIFAAAGRRVLVGAGFALVVFSLRGVIVETAAGETVIPAAAAALAAVVLASRPAPNLLATGLMTAIALWFRLDNVLIVPGVAAAIAVGRPKGERLAPTVRLLVASGLVTILGYVAAWMVATGGAPPFPAWLLAELAPWSGAGDLDPTRFSYYLSAVAVATTGQRWPMSDPQPLLGLVPIAATLASGAMLLGTEPRVRLGLPVLVTLVLRAWFHTWYEAENFEWLLLPLSFLAAFSAGLARGEPATGRILRYAGGAILVALAACALLSHAPSTWRLRERRLTSVIEEAVAGPRAQWRILAQGGRVATGLKLLGVRYEDVPEAPSDPVKSMRSMMTAIGASPVPTVAILDRLVLSGMPYEIEHHESWRLPYDDLGDTPAAQFLRRGGLTCAMFITPPAAASRPGSRG
jgi:hypothetical protein